MCVVSLPQKVYLVFSILKMLGSWQIVSPDKCETPNPGDLSLEGFLGSDLMSQLACLIAIAIPYLPPGVISD